MQKSSWIMLGVAAVLCAFLTFAYITSHNDPGPMTQARAAEMLKAMQDAAERKDVNGVMARISPDPETRIAGVSPNQLRSYMAKGFLSAGEIHVTTDNLMVQNNGEEALLDFNLTVKNMLIDYSGYGKPSHVVLHLRPIAIPQFLGLYHTNEWRITGGTTDGPPPITDLE